MSEQLGPDTLKQLEEVEQLIIALRAEMGQPPEGLGSRAADRVASVIGSWRFLIGQAVILVGYMALQMKLAAANVAFDPYPFILLNLILSFQAAFAAPVILMAQNRADAKDRRAALKAYRTIGQIDALLKANAKLGKSCDE